MIVLLCSLSLRKVKKQSQNFYKIMLPLYKNGKSKDNNKDQAVMIKNRKNLLQKDGPLLMIKTLVIMLMAMVKSVLQLNLKLK